MDENVKMFSAEDVSSVDQAADLMGKLIDVAKPGTVYAEPVRTGEYTIITASEVSIGMGFGFGSGSGPSPKAEGQAGPDPQGSGSGGGGGGGAMGRPVAAIIIGPNGVEIEPIVDATKVALAMFTALASMVVMWRRFQKG